MSQKVYLLILKIGVWLSFYCVLIVFRSVLFPFISSKQITFNILMEILLVFWLVFIIKFPQWNPFGKFAGKRTKNLVTWGLVAYFASLFLSLLVTVDFNLSMWGDIERMLGAFHILHFGILYLVAITVFRDKKDWKITFMVALASIVLVALNGTSDAKSTIGNVAYVAALMLFGIWFTFILFYFDHSRKKGNNFLKWAYFLFLPLLLIILKRTDNDGTFVGIGAGVITFLFLAGITSRFKKLKIAACVSLVLVIGFLSLYYYNFNNPNFVKIGLLQKINFSKNTFQTRLISWNAAWLDFKNHPLLGVGHGNYATIFDKYFKAGFYDHSRGETYFDRAHNNIVDITSTTGIVGLLAYMSIFGFVGFYLIVVLRKKRITGVEFSLWVSLFIAYFVHNLAVFDAFVTYLCLMAVLGYIHWLANTNDDNDNTQALLAVGGEKGLVNKEIYTYVIVGAISLFLIFQYNISVFTMLQKVISGQQTIGGGKFKEGYLIYKDAFSKNTVLDRDGRSMYLRTFASQISAVGNLKNSQDKEDIINFSIEVALKNLAYNPGDSMMQMEVARTYDAAAKLTSDKNKSKEYAEKSLEAVDKSIKASPERIPLYFIKAQFLVGLGRVDEAVSGLEYAATLNENFFETYCQLGQIYILKGNIAGQDKTALRLKGYEAMDKCLDNNGGNMLAVEGVIVDAIRYYSTSTQRDLNKVIQLYEQLTDFRQKDPDVWKNLALLYAQAGNVEKAEKAARVAVQFDPSLAKDVEEFVRQLKNKK